MTNIISNGTRVRITEKVRKIGGPRQGEPGSYIGATGAVAAYSADYDAYRIDFDDDTLDVSCGHWSHEALEVIEAPARPVVSFAGNSRATAREYAKAANSRVLKVASQGVLEDASHGYDVDAYALNEAVLDAMRSAATRMGQSMARRDLTRKVAYLGHIVQAVIEAHADNLPAYEVGERSRFVQDAKQALEEARIELDHSVEVNQRLTQDLTEARNERGLLTQAASDERRRLVAQVDDTAAISKRLRADKDVLVNRNESLNRQLIDARDARDEAEADAERLLAVADKRDSLLAEVVVDRETLAVALAYAIDNFLEPTEAERVFGYLEGLKHGIKGL